MNSTKRLQPILGIAIRHQEQRETALAQALRQKQHAEQQMTVLRDYRCEYTQQLQQSASLNLSQLQNHRHFIAQLDVAIEQQTERLASIDTATHQHMHAWQQARNKRDALEKLVEQKQLHERRLLEQREQKEQDAIAARIVTAMAPHYY